LLWKRQFPPRVGKVGLAEIATVQPQGLDNSTITLAETSAQRGEIALTRLRYREAAAHFGEAARLVSLSSSAYEDKQIDYLTKEAGALYRQEDEFFDNNALLLALEKNQQLLKLVDRKRAPLRWAETQDSLGVALLRLGEREREPAKLELSITAFQEALTERTRDRVPLQWANTKNHLGNALASLGTRETGVDRIQQAITAFRDALQERTREGFPLDWAATKNNLGNALLIFGERVGDPATIDEAVIAFREATKELTSDRAPLQWARTQNNLANALSKRRGI
jgi:tetratricopeptide (TPR) repeat protein